MTLTLSPTLPQAAAVCPVAGFGTLRADAERLTALRRKPGIFAGKPISPGHLKNTDDQTVAAIGVLLQTIADAGWRDRSFTDWGVLAAPNLFGRYGTAQALKRFRSEGAWGISPHMIPHHSLHAVSGLISQLLQIHGPNFGINGGPDAVSEAFLAAATMLAEADVPGLWVLLTGFEPEFIPDEESAKPIHTTDCCAVALAFESDSSRPSRCSLHIDLGGVGAANRQLPAFSLGSFLACLESGNSQAVGWQLSVGGSLKLAWNIGAEMQR